MCITRCILRAHGCMLCYLIWRGWHDECSDYRSLRTTGVVEEMRRRRISSAREAEIFEIWILARTVWYCYRIVRKNHTDGIFNRVLVLIELLWNCSKYAWLAKIAQRKTRDFSGIPYENPNDPNLTITSEHRLFQIQSIISSNYVSENHPDVQGLNIAETASAHFFAPPEIIPESCCARIKRAPRVFNAQLWISGSS